MYKMLNLSKTVLFISSLASFIQLNPVLASSPKTVISSNNFPLGLEDRTIREDYQPFFETNPNIRSNVGFSPSDVFGYIGNNGLYDDDGVWYLDEDIRLLVNEPLVEQNLLVPSWRDYYNDIGRFEFRYDLLE